jgi:hypothetical protein
MIFNFRAYSADTDQSAAFTNALNFSGFSCLTVRLLFDLKVVAGCLG